MAIEDYSTTAALNTSINGVNVDELCPAPNLNNAIRELMADLASFAAGSIFPAGTTMLFVQSAAPTGWTKSVAHDNTALRVVNGTAGSGGSVAFTTAFASQAVSGTTDGHALNINEMPAHAHGNGVPDIGSGDFNYGTQTPSTNNSTHHMATTGGAGTQEGLTESKGGGSGHTHGFAGALNLAVAYVDCIIASKN